MQTKPSILNVSSSFLIGAIRFYLLPLISCPDGVNSAWKNRKIKTNCAPDTHVWIHRESTAGKTQSNRARLVLFSLTKRLNRTKLISYEDFSVSVASDELKKSSEVHQHLTRPAVNLNLFSNYGRLEARKNSIKIYAPMLWNNIPSHIRNVSSNFSFKMALKSHFFVNILSVSIFYTLHFYLYHFFSVAHCSFTCAFMTFGVLILTVMLYFAFELASL